LVKEWKFNLGTFCLPNRFFLLSYWQLLSSISTFLWQCWQRKEFLSVWSQESLLKLSLNRTKRQNLYRKSKIKSTSKFYLPKKLKICSPPGNMRAKNFATSIGARSKSDEAFSTNKLETGSLFDKKNGKFIFSKWSS